MKQTKKGHKALLREFRPSILSLLKSAVKVLSEGTAGHFTCEDGFRAASNRQHRLAEPSSRKKWRITWFRRRCKDICAT
jgi:hypothetical protein